MYKSSAISVINIKYQHYTIPGIVVVWFGAKMKHCPFCPICKISNFRISQKTRLKSENQTYKQQINVVHHLYLHSLKPVLRPYSNILVFLRTYETFVSIFIYEIRQQNINKIFSNHNYLANCCKIYSTFMKHSSKIV